MGGVLEELHARGLLQAIDQQARDRVHDVAAGLDKHEAVCAERYAGIQKSTDAIAKAMTEFRNDMKKRLDNGTARFKRMEIAIAAIVISIVVAAIKGDNPFFERVLDIGARYAAKIIGL